MGLISDLFETEDEQSGADDLISALEQPRGSLDLTAEFGEPYYSDGGVPTAVFPYDLYDAGEHYGMGNKEFEIPNGFDDVTGLKDVLAQLTDTEFEEVTPADLTNVEGKTCEAALDVEGDLMLFV
jgi:hypothetical protein